MPKATAKAESRHEHWFKKSIIVSIIASIVIALGVLSLNVYSLGHLTPFTGEIASASFWIAAVALIIIALLVDFVASSLKKVFWIEDIVGGILGAFGYYLVVRAVAAAAYTTLFGFILGFVVLFALFYLGFAAGHWIDRNMLRKAGININ